MKITGFVHKVCEPINGTMKDGSPFVKQTVVIAEPMEDGRQRPVAITALGEKGVAKLADVKDGQRVDVWFHIQSREYEGRWYTECVLSTINVLTVAN